MPRARTSVGTIVLATIGAGFGFIAAFGFLLATVLVHGREQALADARSTVEQVARSVEQQAHRTMITVDATLVSLTAMLKSTHRGLPLDSAAVKDLLRQFDQQSFELRDVTLLTLEGTELNASTTPLAQPIDPALLGAIQHGAAALVIDRPKLDSRSGLWSVMVARRITLQDGFEGIVAAQLPTELFTDFYTAISPPPGTSIALLLDDGTLIAAEPRDLRLVGETLVPAAHREGRPRVELVDEPSIFTGSDSIAAWRRVPARPLLVRVGIEKERALAAWHGDLRAYSLLFLGVALLGTVVIAGLVRLTLRRERAERTGAAAQRRLDRAIEAMPDAFALFDRADRLVLWNANYPGFFPYLAPVLRRGMTFEEILDHTVRLAPLGDDPGAREAWRAWRLERQRHATDAFEQEMGDGRCYHTIARRTQEGETVVVIRDITRLKEAEREAHQSRDAAEAANRSKSAFLANMSHELRTPLNAILGFSDLIRGGMFGQHARYMEYASDIHRAGSHLLTIVNDVLDLSKIETGAMVLHEEEADMAAVVAACHGLVRAKAEEGKLRLSYRGLDALPPVWADGLRMKQVVLNLLSNAVKYTLAGGKVEVAAAVASDGDVVLAVSDTGIGMRQQDIPVALQAFGQVDAELSRRFEGTGLGLPLARRLMELHGGTLEIDSEFGVGTTVTIRLPATRVLAGAEAASA